MQKTISVIVPVLNEENNISILKEEIFKIFKNISYDLELIFINDGSSDNSQEIIEDICLKNNEVKYIEFSRTFGKERAISAGFKFVSGDAVIVIDADLQHPPSIILEMIKKWELGSDVVIGLRENNGESGLIRKIGSNTFYYIMNILSETPFEKGSTDFRIMDRQVVDEFNKFTEKNRITRGLIDWLGFSRDFVKFKASKRNGGKTTFSFIKLFKLAISSAVSHSLFPLKLSGYLGLFVMIISSIGGGVVIFEMYILNDPLGWSISGTAQLAILLVFFLGIILSCLGLIALYIGNIHDILLNRPLYVIKKTNNINKE